MTKYVHSGRNALGALLAEGWWSGGATFTGDNWNFFGDRQSLLAKLVITYADGRTNVVVTDPLSWQYFGKGPVAYGSFFQGEVYDALREPAVEGWSTASYDASAWKPAHEVALEGHISTAGNRDIPTPSQALIALRAVRRNGKEVAVRRPGDILPQLVHPCIRSFVMRSQFVYRA